ncbi:up-regulator of cell proliferation-like [Brienomyrus brachyistius]|uniref:up-regulator of cell proliferation-like n=1 Tax=Brienomyrus brachyistius TaxID=42636 RepID=UPI0020B1B316|nr:up-regulator of cell proliferation-like [Brienomyrus brachyistius]
MDSPDQPDLPCFVAHKEHGLRKILCKLGLEEYYPNKMSLQCLLKITGDSITDTGADSERALPMRFLKRLMMLNAECRSTVAQTEDYDEDDGESDTVNPLDLVIAIFHCADSFLQQAMMLKMSMCQFALPLLLPPGTESQCTLMLWAMQDIRKEWRPHNLLDTRGFVEDGIVNVSMPFISFVRLRKCSLPKSQLLNEIMGKAQQIHNIFTHIDMEAGNVPRYIVDGLVEITWYLPCGNKNLDIFPKPLAVANLRGDICSSETQFAFLTKVSSAIFVFLDQVEEAEIKLLSSIKNTAPESKFLLVVKTDKETKRINDPSIEQLISQLQLQSSNIISKSAKDNKSRFSNKLTAAVTHVMQNCKHSITLRQISSVAYDLGIQVDEDQTDASRSGKKAAKEVEKTIGVREVADYKKNFLPLQGEPWKRLAQLEKEECRLLNPGDQHLETYKAQLQEEIQDIKNKQGNYQTTKPMLSFINALSTSDKQERAFFLKWLSLSLDTHSQKVLSKLRRQLKEAQKQKIDKDTLARLDQQLLDSSLGIEHYFREMGQIYEVFKGRSNMFSDLPNIAAEILLNGVPLELLDGDASNIPVNWVRDVLMKLHSAVGEISRLWVVAVLGVQSTGKSTLLNAMFGVQFPVSSGRCTRGAFMLLLKIEEDLREELGCDLILLIDTEGLKSSEMSQLEDSYEHDNQIATLVVGLSDITIINIAMENSTEMKDILQIVVHAFLRMKEVGKKPRCHFVHQNVAGVSAHSKTTAERRQLIDQLDEMVKIAAKMEKQTEVVKFTDVLDYDVEKNNWYIPGLWHGTPPMAPVNTGYSEAVHEFKNHLIEEIKSCKTERHPSQIPEFLEWMQSLWKAVKYENFIFSFRNTLVAHAYDNLCRDFNQWEWEFRKQILQCVAGAEVQISHFLTENADNLNDLQQFITKIKQNASSELKTEEQKMTEKLKEYYKRKDRHVHLIEKYKVDFFNSIRCLQKEIEHVVNNKLDTIVELERNMKKVRDIHSEHMKMIEEQVSRLLKSCKDTNTQLSDEQLSIVFEKMWTETVINIAGLKERDIDSSVFAQLHLVKSQKDYSDTFTNDLLKKIDHDLVHKNLKTNTKCEVDLKLYICSHAARDFLEMHRQFLKNKDPRQHLEDSKFRYLSDFLDLYHEKDHCQRKVTDFVNLCLKPAVTDYINRSLGIDIVDEMLTSTRSTEYSSRSYFQFTILKELLQKDDFQSYVKYILKYEIFVKDWILMRIINELSSERSIVKLKSKNLAVIIQKINEAIETAKADRDDQLLPNDIENTSILVKNLCRTLSKDMRIPMDVVEGVLFQIKSKPLSFTDSLLEAVKDLEKLLKAEFDDTKNIPHVLQGLAIKPQDELFKRVFGCGQQCPFCLVHCEAGGNEHNKHFASVHRPQAFGSYRCMTTEILCETICTTDVHSENCFKNCDTNGELHPYKNYHSIYPDWIIPPDVSIEASDYWKYVLQRYNDRFAEEYKAKPAEIPDAWKQITREKALESLNIAYSIKGS